jgi:hypothetical protein
MEERLRWKRQEIRDARVISKLIESPSWRYAQVASDRRRDPVSPASTASHATAESIESEEQMDRGDWTIGFELYVVELCRSRCEPDPVNAGATLFRLVLHFSAGYFVFFGIFCFWFRFLDQFFSKINIFKIIQIFKFVYILQIF